MRLVTDMTVEQRVRLEEVLCFVKSFIACENRTDQPWGIYGGAVRDAVALMPETYGADIDVLCLPRTYHKILKDRKDALFAKRDESEAQELSLYDDVWGQVCHPTDFLHEGRIIQLMRPKPSREQLLTNGAGDAIDLKTLLVQPSVFVDILCCALFLAPNGALYEMQVGAFQDATKRVARPMILPMVNYKNLSTRMVKLVKRGFSLGSPLVTADQQVKDSNR